MHSLVQDLRYALRLHASDPGFAAVAIFTLALGIGANTAIFSVVDGVLLRRAPVADLDRLAMVWETDRNSGTTREPASVPDYLDFKERSRTFETLGGLIAAELNLTPASGEPVRLAGLRVSHDLLPMLGLDPIVGRHFTRDEDRANGPHVALISESLWERSLGGDRGVVGSTIRLNERPYTIVGVVPDAADFGVLQILTRAAYSRSFADRGTRVRVDVWAPLQPNPESSPRETHPLFVLGRLAPSATHAAAQQEMTAITADLERAYRAANDGRGAFIEPMREVVFGPVRPALLVLLGAVGLVLLVACVNVANLLLARGAARGREIAVRMALGASAGRLARQLLTETVVLTLVAAAAGVGLAVAGLRALLAIAPSDVPRLSAVALDLRVLAVTLGVSIAVGLAFGIVPLMQAWRVDPQTALKGDIGRAGSAGRGRSRLRGALVVAELSLAVVLLAGAGLLIKSFWRLQQVDAGFTANGVLKAEYQLPGSRYPVNFRRWPDFKEMHAFTDRLLRRAAALPGADASAIAGNHPLDHGFTNSFVVVGREAEARGWPEISLRRVTPGYFRTVGLRLVRGRLLRDSDTTTAATVALINEAAAHRFFPTADPIGARIAFWGAARTIVGVVANEKFHGLAEAPPLAAYVPLAQAPSANGAGVLLLRTDGDPAALASAARAAIRDVDPALAVFAVEPLVDTVARSVGERRFTMLLLGLFAAIALALAAIGVHGVLSYGVAQRTREIGIRMALGARPARVLRLVVGEGVLLATAGIAVGLAGALALTRLLANLLFGVTPTDPATLAAAVLLLASIAAVASYLPARRALRVDPAVALRAE
jgi:putative ABC transport system permease protein